jgi:toxin ParE1/3/4
VRELSLTPQAEADLVEIWMYTCEAWGAEQADEYLDQLGESMKHLIDHPALGADYSHVRSGYRRLHSGHHAVFYQALEAEIRVVRVLHEEMDAPRRLIE